MSNFWLNIFGDKPYSQVIVFIIKIKYILLENHTIFGVQKEMYNNNLNFNKQQKFKYS